MAATLSAENVQLGIAPIGWTNDDLPELGGEITFEQCVSEMALAGFTGCEVGNKYPRNPETLAYYLNLRKLKICNQWFSYELTTKSLEENIQAFEAHLDFLQAMGTSIVGGGEVGTSCQGKLDVPVFEGKGMLKNEAAWQQFISRLNHLGQIAKDRGMKLAFHHHMGTVIQTLPETLKMLDETDPELVWLNYDCGHFHFSGEDPVAALEQVIDRVAHVHVKDVRPHILKKVQEDRMSFLDAVKSGVFTVPGDPEGCIDFPSIFSILEAHQYKGWVVVEAEQDPAKANPFEYALIARNYIHQQTGL
ncbi:MAG: myo-inosose-2 dehydratase [Bacteroidota bacterium]